MRSIAKESRSSSMNFTTKWSLATYVVYRSWCHVFTIISHAGVLLHTWKARADSRAAKPHFLLRACYIHQETHLLHLIMLLVTGGRDDWLFLLCCCCSAPGWLPDPDVLLIFIYIIYWEMSMEESARHALLMWTEKKKNTFFLYKQRLRDVMVTPHPAFAPFTRRVSFSPPPHSIRSIEDYENSI